MSDPADNDSTPDDPAHAAPQGTEASPAAGHAPAPPPNSAATPPPRKRFRWSWKWGCLTIFLVVVLLIGGASLTLVWLWRSEPAHWQRNQAMLTAKGPD